MKNNELKKYAEMKAYKQKEMTDLVEKVKGEERAMTPEEDELFNQLEKDIQAINDTVAKINKSRQLTEEDGASKNDEKNNNLPPENRFTLSQCGQYLSGTMERNSAGTPDTDCFFPT